MPPESEGPSGDAARSVAVTPARRHPPAEPGPQGDHPPVQHAQAPDGETTHDPEVH